jgi:hypothetical protein
MDILKPVDLADSRDSDLGAGVKPSCSYLGHSVWCLALVDLGKFRVYPGE